MTILVYGDSNCYGTMPLRHHGDYRRYPVSDRWVTHLAQTIDHEIITEGLPRRTICVDDPIEGAHRNGLTVLPAVLHSHTPLDLVVLKLGTNDCKARFSLTTRDIALAKGQMIDAVRFHVPDVPILVICPAKVQERGCLAEVFCGAAACSEGLAVQMGEIATNKGAAFFDAGSVISTDPLDGVHYSAGSHAVLAKALVPVVQTLLSS